MLFKPLSTWIVSKQSEEYTYYFDPESAILAYQYCDYPGIMIISMQGKNLYKLVFYKTIKICYKNIIYFN